MPVHTEKLLWAEIYVERGTEQRFFPKNWTWDVQTNQEKYLF